MIQSLAEVLSSRPTATMIQEIQTLDDETAAQTLRYFKSEKRQAVLAGLTPNGQIASAAAFVNSAHVKPFDTACLTPVLKKLTHLYRE